MQNLFSHPLIVDDLTATEKAYKLKANPEELKYITEILKVVDAKVFEAEIKVKLNKREHRLDVWGKAKAKLELMSVVSLENFTKTYEPEFTLVYDTKPTLKNPKEAEIEIDIEDEVPEPVIDGKVDLAEIAMEQIALEIDDFPRKDGEVFKFESEFDEETTQQVNPFAALAKLKK